MINKLFLRAALALALVIPAAAPAQIVNPTFIQSGAGAVSRTFLDKARERLSVLDFGARASAADNGPAVSAGCARAAATGKELWIPAGVYPMTTAVTAAAVCSIVGEGPEKSILRWDGAAGVAPLNFNPTAQQNFIQWRNFGVLPSVAGNGAAGIILTIANVSGAIFANSVIDSVWIGDFASYGLVLDNSVNSASGFSAFFMLDISRNYVANGIKMLYAGDSITIEKNNIPCLTPGTPAAPSTQSLTTGVYILGIPGAAQKVIRSNNITTASGAIAIIGGMQDTIANNQTENPIIGNANYKFTTNAVNGGAQIHIKDSHDVRVIGNTVQTGAGNALTDANVASYGVLFAGASQGGVVRDNNITPGNIVTGTRYHIGFLDTAFGNIVGVNSYAVTANALSYYLTNPQAYPQIGIHLNINVGTGTSLWTNGWSLDGTNGDTRIDLVLSENGVAHLYGAVHNVGASGALNQAIIKIPPALIPSLPSSSITAGVNAAGARISTDSGVMYLAFSGGAYYVMMAAVPDVNHAMFTGISFPYFLTR